tara:strand:- start:1559 stop:1951 length:393 start_codon:yes stop_codon:yes gene_type:complete
MVNKQAKKDKVTAVAEESVAEDVTEPTQVISGYVVPVLFQREPTDKNIPVADIFYRKFSNLVEVQCHKPNFHAELEMIVAGDISVLTETGAITCISKSEAPISWITSLYKSREFAGNPFIATEAQELYEV